MYKIYTREIGMPKRCIHKILLIMRLTAVLIIATIMQVSATGFAQRVSIVQKNVSLKKIFREIHQQTGYDFLYNRDLLNAIPAIDVDVRNEALDVVLGKYLNGFGLTFKIEEKTVVISKKENSILESLASAFNDINIQGIINDESGLPLEGATITIKGTTRKVVSGKGGEFSLNGVDEKEILIVSYLGYVNQEVKVAMNLTIRMKLAENKMKDVIITGMGITRKKDSFTGASATFTGEELRQIGNRNVLTSLKTLDPSFIILENNLQGSNPNALPTIELRGKTSITTTDVNSQFNSDPNQPLFILDGFETTLEIINNLDMNRVSSITILKDAASTAMYGSRAANGVVVIETKRPVAGKLQVNYTSDLLFETPDLSTYNMMNASEKLQFEKLSGLYTAPNATAQYDMDQRYNAKLAEVLRGVNTDWMNIPIRNGFTTGNSLQLTGGSDELLFTAGLLYRDQTGVIKGSSRETFSGNVDVNYRKGKINIINSLYYNSFTAENSNYGSFSDYVNSNPYYRAVNPDGSFPKYLDQSAAVNYTFGGVGNYTRDVANPLYNASFEGVDNSKSQEFRNNLRMIWDFAPQFRLQGGLQVNKGITTAIKFIPPENSSFDGTPALQKGSYTNSRTDQTGYNGNLVLTYAKVINNDHQVNANIRTEIREDALRLYSTSAVGFPNGTNGNPAFSFGYTPFSAPVAASQITRSTSVLATFNYAYKLRYLLDASYNRSGTNAFGSDNKFSDSWAVGLGWNLHHEEFFKGLSWIDLLKISANIGKNGNQQLGVFTSNSVYNNQSTAYLFGSALDVNSFGNPGLEWQSTMQKTISFDFAALKNRISGQFSYYQKITDPLVINANQNFFPPSVGITSAYPINLGKLDVDGWEGTFRFSPIYKAQDKVVWTIGVTASANHSVFKDMSGALNEWNKEQTNNNSLIRYKDGYSPDDIWAVQSYGIDPATGRELFVKQDGTLTTEYSATDIRKVGNSRPDVQGIINSSILYKGFYLNLNLRYWLGGQLMNTALYNKVENISLQGLKYNQDKRALTDRWKNPGDLSQFKGIDITESTPISSRFIQKENYLSGESISFGWRFYADGWIKKLKMQTLDIRAYTNDIFRLSNLTTERGIDYPFGHTYSMSINVTF